MAKGRVRNWGIESIGGVVSEALPEICNSVSASAGNGNATQLGPHVYLRLQCHE